LAQGLRSGVEDRSGDGRITLSDLYKYVHADLAARGKQTPFKRFSGAGDVTIAFRAKADTATAISNPVESALAHPQFEVVPSDIDLGDVDPDEELPPERITVVNRANSTMRWTVEQSHSWIRAEPTDFGAVLHVRPPAGARRANVWFHDTATGALRTVRLRVRVRPMPATAAPSRVDLPGDVQQSTEYSSLLRRQDEASSEVEPNLDVAEKERLYARAREIDKANKLGTSIHPVNLKAGEPLSSGIRRVSPEQRIAALQEVVALLRRVGRAPNGSGFSFLASALDEIAQLFWRFDPQAVPAAEEAVALRRRDVGDKPDTRLATYLRTLSEKLDQAKRSEDTLRIAEEAVSEARRAAGSDPKSKELLATNLAWLAHVRQGLP
jgi:hypothetical protein